MPRIGYVQPLTKGPASSIEVNPPILIHGVLFYRTFVAGNIRTSISNTLQTVRKELYSRNPRYGLRGCHGFAPRQSSILYSSTKLGETRLARTSTLEFSSALYGIGSARLGVHKRVFRFEDSLPLLLSSCFVLIATLVN